MNTTHISLQRFIMQIIYCMHITVSEVGPDGLARYLGSSGAEAKGWCKAGIKTRAIQPNNRAYSQRPLHPFFVDHHSCSYFLPSPIVRCAICK